MEAEKTSEKDLIPGNILGMYAYHPDERVIRPSEQEALLQSRIDCASASARKMTHAVQDAKNRGE